MAVGLLAHWTFSRCVSNSKSNLPIAVLVILAVLLHVVHHLSIAFDILWSDNNVVVVAAAYGFNESAIALILALGAGGIFALRHIIMQGLLEKFRFVPLQATGIEGVVGIVVSVIMLIIADALRWEDSGASMFQLITVPMLAWLTVVVLLLQFSYHLTALRGLEAGCYEHTYTLFFLVVGGFVMACELVAAVVLDCSGSADRVALAHERTSCAKLAGVCCFVAAVMLTLRNLEATAATPVILSPAAIETKASFLSTKRSLAYSDLVRSNYLNAVLSTKTVKKDATCPLCVAEQFEV